MRVLKQWGKSVVRALGCEIRRVQPPAGANRPIGQLASVLQDVRARGFSPSLVFDAGASDGAWTREVRSVYPLADVVLVEPRPQQRSALDALSRRDPRCRPITAA